MDLDQKVKIKEEGRFKSRQIFGYGKRGYYFHADEDFREDWSWEKNNSTELPNNSVKSQEKTGLSSIL